MRLAAVLALASCQRQPTDGDCDKVAICLRSPPGMVLGSDPAVRVAAARELRFAAVNYSAWFDGEGPPPGLIILDSGARDIARSVARTTWTLDFAPGERLGGKEPVRLGEAPFRMSGPNGVSKFGRGTLSHEICHNYASYAFKRRWGRDRTLPDMLDEVSAISCEQYDMKNDRLQQFAQDLDQASPISWNIFLNARHPLKNPEALEAINRLAKPGSGAVAFDVQPGSAYGSALAMFYAQAAAFGAFLDARSCRGKRIIGQLLSTYDPTSDLDHWLLSNGARFCLPSSIAAFETEFERYIEQVRRGSSD